MQLTKQQLEMQEAILLAVHKWCTLEYAYSIECDHNDDWYRVVWHVKCWRDTIEEREYCSSNGHNIRPSTLSRVLTALGDEFIYWHNKIRVRSIDEFSFMVFCDRKLLNEDWSDCNLLQQSQETQDIIYSLICK